MATGRVATAVAAADREGIVLTARAENHLRGHDDLDDTIARLRAFRDAGAHVVYAPALPDTSAVARVVEEVGGAVNVLLTPGGPRARSLPRSASGGCPSVARWPGWPMAMYQAAEQLLDSGALPPNAAYLSREVAKDAFAGAG